MTRIKSGKPAKRLSSKRPGPDDRRKGTFGTFKSLSLSLTEGDPTHGADSREECIPRAEPFH